MEPEKIGSTGKPVFCLSNSPEGGLGLAPTAKYLDGAGEKKGGSRGHSPLVRGSQGGEAPPGDFEKWRSQNHSDNAFFT